MIKALKKVKNYHDTFSRVKDNFVVDTPTHGDFNRAIIDGGDLP